jgi:UDP-N-acetylglucosamine--N-acetylmuramyl-(pentapeptide) pyrophosphoryl-undecaprenol N-acetylglucosamine transferase
MSKRIIIAGGGTGGHIFPAVAIANALKKLSPAVEILFVGANGKMEMEKVPKEGYEIIGLDIAGMNRSNMLKNISLPYKLIKSATQAKKVIQDFKPDLCVGVGGYASFPILRAAQKRNIPTVLQEQNSFAGKSNKILGKKAKAIFTGYEGMEKFFPADKIVYTGNPVRSVIQDMNVDKAAAYKFFGLDATKKTLFVFGGSLGAQSINQALLSCIEKIAEQDIQIIWQTGKTFAKEAKEATSSLQNVKVFDFLREMEMAYTLADVIVSRAGALSIAELSIVGKSVIFVPYPHAAEDHQTHNAMALVSKQAAEMITDSEVSDKLLKEVQSLFGNESRQKELAQNIKPFARKNADKEIAKQILQLAK